MACVYSVNREIALCRQANARKKSQFAAPWNPPAINIKFIAFKAYGTRAKAIFVIRSVPTLFRGERAHWARKWTT